MVKMSDENSKELAASNDATTVEHSTGDDVDSVAAASPMLITDAGSVTFSDQYHDNKDSTMKKNTKSTKDVSSEEVRAVVDCSSSSSASSDTSPSPAHEPHVHGTSNFKPAKKSSTVGNNIGENGASSDIVGVEGNAWDGSCNGDDVNGVGMETVMVNGTTDNMSDIATGTDASYEDTECDGLSTAYVPPMGFTGHTVPPDMHVSPSNVHVHNHTVCSGGGGESGVGGIHVTGAGGASLGVTGSHSPHTPSPADSHSSRGSPHDSGGGGVTPGGGGGGLPQGGGGSGANQQYVVNVHVNPGETFSVRVGDQVQLIQGPATVRMVSNSGPPMPMPMQVPPGHMVQQIVDENGILTHVILSPQPPGIPAPPMMGAPNGNPQPMYQPYGPQYPTYPHHPYVPHHPINPRHVHPMGGGMSAHMHPGPPPPPPPSHHQCGGNHHLPGAPPPPQSSVGPVGGMNHVGGPGPGGGGGGNRAQRTRARLLHKLNTRQRPPPPGELTSSASTGGHQPTTPSSSGRKHSPGCQQRSTHLTNAGGGGDGQSGRSSINDNEDEECKVIRELLSKLQPPKVSDVEARSALIQLTPPQITGSTELDLVDCSEFQYELQLSEKKDSNFTVVYSGDATEIKLRDLKPATEYFLKVTCLLDELRGEPVETTSFLTPCCEPDAPPQPKLTTKTKTSLNLKWNAAVDNGSKITSHILEYDQGRGDMKFVEVYNGSQRTAKVAKLSPSMGYMFRLAAVNACGKSRYCEPVVLYTSGTVPSQTDPPMLSEQCIKALTISWIRRPSDDSFTLQMDDDSTGHGFLTIYNGADLSYKIPHLRRNTEYKFRLQASNEEGSSKWSDVVSYRTLPDRPQPPPRPSLKGRATSHCFRLIWDEPKDTGGVDISRYRLQLDAGNGYQQVHDTAEREFSAERLQPGHTYRVRICAVGPGGQSEWSEVLIVTTQAIPPGVCNPPRLHGRPKATTLCLIWEDPEYDGGSQPTEYAVLMTSSDTSSTREVYRGADLECTVAGLLPGRGYQFQIKAFNKVGAGPWSEALDIVTGPGVPDAPKHVDVHCKSPHSAVISWDEPCSNGASISEYRLEWQAKDEPDFTPLYSGSSPSFEISRLSPATFYAFRVQAVNSAGAGAFSAAASVVTPPSSPGQVLSPRTTATATTITVSWKEPPCNGSKITSYNIDIGERHVLSVDNVLEYCVQDLTPETIYKVRVQAVNSIGVGAFSAVVKVTTRALPPNPPCLECVAAGSNSLKLKWGDGRNPDLVQYCLEAQRDNGSFHVIYQGTAHTYKVTKLAELSDHHFRIFASNDAGDGPVSNIFTFQTIKAAPPAPKGPKFSIVNSAVQERHSCTVEWSPVKSIGRDVIVYILQLQRMSGKDLDFHEVYRGQERSYTLTGLQPKTDYQLRVCAVRQCDDGSPDLIGPFSPSVVMTTASLNRSVSEGSTGSASEASHSAGGRNTGGGGRRLTEQHWAIIFLLAFALFAIVVAFVAKQIVDYSMGMSGGGGAGSVDTQGSVGGSGSTGGPMQRQYSNSVNETVLAATIDEDTLN